jgi:hypothetical protein
MADNRRAGMSLSLHLSSGEGHGALGFRRDCPICRGERLSGTLAAGEPVVPARVKAGVVAAVLAGSAVAPAAAAAQDQGPPIELPPPSALDNLPDEEVPPGAEEGQPDPSEVMLGEDPALDDGAPSEDDGVVPPGTVDPDLGEDPDAPPPGAQGAEPQAGPEPKPSAPSPQPPETTPAPAPAPKAHEAPRPRPVRPAPRRSKPAPPSAPAAQAPEPPAPAPPPQAPKAAQPVSASASEPAPTPPAPTGDTYVVRSGDTLWSIARSLLGTDPGPAEIARKVDLLWRLNAGRIHSGRPDLIQPGERLRLE